MKNWFIKLKIAAFKSRINSLVKLSQNDENDEIEHISDFMDVEVFQEEDDLAGYGGNLSTDDTQAPSLPKKTKRHNSIPQDMKKDVMTYVELLRDPSQKDKAEHLFTKIYMDAQEEHVPIETLSSFISDAMSSGLVVNKDIDTSDLDKAINNEKKKLPGNFDALMLFSLLNRLIRVKLNSEIKQVLIDRDDYGFLKGVKGYAKRSRASDLVDSILRSDVSDEYEGVKLIAESVGEMIFIISSLYKSMTNVPLNNKNDTVSSFFVKHEKYFPEEEYRRDISREKLNKSKIIKDYNKTLEIDGVERRLIVHLIFILMDLVNSGNSDIIEFCATRVAIMMRESDRRKSFDEYSANDNTGEGSSALDQIEEKGSQTSPRTDEEEKRAKRQQDRAKRISDNLPSFYNGLQDVSNKINGVKAFLISKMGGVSGSDGYANIIDAMLDEYNNSIMDISIRIQNLADNNSTADEVGMSVALMSDDKISFKFNKNEVVLDSLNDFGSFDFTPNIDYQSMYESAILSGRSQELSQDKYAAFLATMNNFISSGDNQRELNNFIQQVSEGRHITSAFVAGVNRISAAKKVPLINDLVKQLKGTMAGGRQINNVRVDSEVAPADRKRILESFISNPRGGVISLKEAVKASLAGQRSIQKINTSKILANETIKFGLDAMQELYNSRIAFTDADGNDSTRARGDDPAVKSILSSMLVGLGISGKICEIVGMITDKKHKYDTEMDADVDTGVVKTYDELIKRIEGRVEKNWGDMSEDDAKKAISLYLKVFNLVKQDGSIDLTELKVHCLKQKYSGTSTTPEVRSAIVNHARQSGSLDKLLWGPRSLGADVGKNFVTHKPDKKSNMKIYIIKLSNVMKRLEFLKVS